MTKTELKKFQNTLTAHQSELEGAIRNRGFLAVATSPELLDQIQQGTDRELAIGNLERESRRLREVQAAFGRIRLGVFGVCLECDEEIGAKRLTAIPWARSCIACQSAADRTYSIPGNSFQGELQPSGL